MIYNNNQITVHTDSVGVSSSNVFNQSLHIADTCYLFINTITTIHMQETSYIAVTGGLSESFINLQFTATKTLARFGNN